MNEWTRRQVEAGAHLSLDELVELWSANATENVVNEHFAMMLIDQLTHEFVIRYALGAPGRCESSGISLSCDFLIASLADAKNVDFHLHLDGETFALGSGTSVVELSTTPFEFMRMRSGRRSWDEITKMNWKGDINAARELFFGNGFFTPATFRINEVTL